MLGSLLAVLALTGVLNVSRGVEISKEQAISIAEARVGFEPEFTTIRLLRQGIDSTPYWAVSLSVREPGGDGFERVTTVVVDAGTGEIAAVNEGE